jgi:hypothetical protein
MGNDPVPWEECFDVHPGSADADEVMEMVSRPSDEEESQPGRTTARLIIFLALFWMTGGLITLRFALAIRPRPGLRLGLAAASGGPRGGAGLLRDRLSGVVDPEVFVGLLGISAVLTGRPSTSNRMARRATR